MCVISASLIPRNTGIWWSERREVSGAGHLHPKKNLQDVVDYTVDCKVKVGDAVLQLPGFEQKIGAVSTYANAYVLNCIVVEAINILVDSGNNPPVWRSGNAPGGDEWNQQFLDRFKRQVRAL